MPFGMRMTIGAAAVVAPLLAAGIAAATLVPDASSPSWVDARTATPAPGDPASSDPAAGGSSGGTPVDVATPAAVSSGHAAARVTAAGRHPGHSPAPSHSPAAGHRTPAGSTAAGHPHGRSTAPGRQPGRPVVAGHLPTRGNAPSPAPAAGGPGNGATPPTRPVVATRVHTEVRRIPFAIHRIDDPLLPAGTRRVREPGEPGSRILTFEVTTVDGREAKRRLVKNTITKRPVTRVVAVGTREPTDECRPDYDDCVYVSVGCPPGETASLDDAARLLDDGIVVLDRARLPAKGGRPSSDGGQTRDASKARNDSKGRDDSMARDDRKARDDGGVTVDGRAEPVCETVLRWR